MSKQIFNENLLVLGLPDRPAFDAMVMLTPEVTHLKEEMIEVLESITEAELRDFIDAAHPTELALAFQKLRTD